MNARPILFSAAMVRALLSGSKSQTRRIVKWPEWVKDHDAAALGLGGRWPAIGLFSDGRPVKKFTCPYGAPGDELLVAMEIPSSPNDDYCAGSDGQIYSRTKYAGFGKKVRTDWYPLAGAVGKSEYRRVTLCHRNKKVTRSVHSLICEAFYGPIPFRGAQVRHLDGDPANNAPFNLRWGTQRENWVDRKAHGRGVEGEKHHAAKLSDEDRAHVRWAVERGLCSQRHAAKMLDVTQAAICALMDGAELRHAEPESTQGIPRLTLRITSVRVERLHAISEADAMAEGVEDADANENVGIGRSLALDTRFRNYDTSDPTNTYCVTARESYASLWETINGAGSWAANPWVWVVGFEVCR